MKGILQLQLFRLKKSTLFWVFLGLCAVLPVFSVLLIFGLDAIMGAIGDVSLVENMGNSLYTSMTQFSSYSTNSALFAMICSSIVLSKEFSQGTVRNTILANKSRTQVFFAYSITALLIGTSYFVVNFVMEFAMLAPVMGFGTLPAGQATSVILCSFAMGLGATLFTQSLVCMFLFCTRKQAATIAWPLVISLVGVGIVASIIEEILFAVEMGGKVVSQTVLDCLPFYNLYMTAGTIPSGLAMGMVILYDVVFAALFFGLGYLSIRKADLK